MNILYILGTIILYVFVLWCLMLSPRRGHPGWEALAKYRYAHRGLHDKSRGVPENSLPAFRAAVERGFGAELDLHLLKDGKLAVFHDSSLKRVCGADVTIEELTSGELKDHTLLDTDHRIPLFEEVLEIFGGKTPLIIELKVVGGNAGPLVEAAISALEGWEGLWCMESFHPSAVRYLKDHYPHVIRGQLSENFMETSEVGGLPKGQAFVMTHLLTTAATKPDFIAYRWQDRGQPAMGLMRLLYRVKEVSWTIRDRETLEKLEKEGCVPIFENFIP